MPVANPAAPMTPIPAIPVPIAEPTTPFQPTVPFSSIPMPTTPSPIPLTQLPLFLGANGQESDLTDIDDDQGNAKVASTSQMA